MYFYFHTIKTQNQTCSFPYSFCWHTHISLKKALDTYINSELLTFSPTINYSSLSLKKKYGEEMEGIKEGCMQPFHPVIVVIVAIITFKKLIAEDLIQITSPEIILTENHFKIIKIITVSIKSQICKLHQQMQQLHQRTQVKVLYY